MGYLKKQVSSNLHEKFKDKEMKKPLFTLAAIIILMKPLYGLMGRNEYLDVAVFIAISVIVVIIINEMMKPRVVDDNVQPFMHVDKLWGEDKRSFLIELKQDIALSTEEMVYVASEEDKNLIRLLESNVMTIDAWARSIGFQIIYLPILIKRLKEKRAFQYYAPHLKDTEIAEIDVQNDFLLQYLANPTDKERMKQGFIRAEDIHGSGGNSDKKFVRFYPLSTKSKESLPDQLDRIGIQIRDERNRNGFHIENDNHNEKQRIDVGSEQEENDILQNDDNNTNILLAEIKEKISELRQRGVSQFIIEQLVRPDNRLSRMAITKDWRIFLLDYNKMEIKMEPLVKAVYFLFLNHPEGIMFKHLPDYREELTRIYNQVKPTGLTNRAIQSIDDVTNPMLNSINEKCARIRAAFVGQFDEYMAKSYYIDGLRGEVKKIALSRNLVIWEKTTILQG